MYGTTTVGPSGLYNTLYQLNRQIAATQFHTIAVPTWDDYASSYRLSDFGSEVKSLLTASSSLLNGRSVVEAALASTRSLSSLLDSFTESMHRLQAQGLNPNAEPFTRLVTDFRKQFAGLIANSYRGSQSLLTGTSKGLTLIADGSYRTMQIGSVNLESALLGRLGEAFTKLTDALRNGNGPPPGGGGTEPPHPPHPPDPPGPPCGDNGNHNGHDKDKDKDKDKVNNGNHYGWDNRRDTAAAVTQQPTTTQTVTQTAQQTGSGGSNGNGNGNGNGGTESAYDKAFRTFFEALDVIHDDLYAAQSYFETSLDRVDIQRDFVKDLIGIHTNYVNTVVGEKNAMTQQRLFRLVDQRNAAMVALLPTLMNAPQGWTTGYPLSLFAQSASGSFYNALI